MIRAPRALAFALSALASCAPPVDEPARPAPRAEPLALQPYALARHGHRVETLDGAVYALGGFAGAGGAPERGTRDVLRLDLATGEWQPRASLLSGKAFAGSAVLGGALYAVGGDVERYDPEREAWEVVIAGPVLPDSHFACAALGERLFVLGGYPEERSGFHVFDAADGTVEALAPPPGFEPTDHFAFLFALDGELHLVGGLDTTDFQPVAQHLVHADGSWTERAPPPLPLWAKFSAAAVVDRSLFVFDGLEGRGLRCDVDQDSWSEVAPLPVKLVMPACLVRSGRILVLGGVPLEGSRAVPRAAVYDPGLDAWRTAP